MRKAFTLVELLVVIAIIAILAMLLIGGLGALFGGEEVVGQVTLKQIGQGEYGKEHWIELTFEDGSKITYSTYASIYNQLQMNEWYKVKAWNNDKITKFIEHIPSEPVQTMPVEVTPTTPTPEPVKPEVETIPQGSAI